MQCKKCGAAIIGDGYTSVFHCENSDENRVMEAEPDAPVILCDYEDDLFFEKDVNMTLNFEAIAKSMKMEPSESFKTECEKLCTIPCDKEEGVFNCERGNYHLCLLKDKHFENYARLAILSPYVWRNIRKDKDLGGPVGYAWVDKDGNFYSNEFLPVHPDDAEFVVAFRRKRE